MVCGRRVKAIYVGPAPRTEPPDFLYVGGGGHAVWRERRHHHKWPRRSRDGLILAGTLVWPWTWERRPSRDVRITDARPLLWRHAWSYCTDNWQCCGPILLHILSLSGYSVAKVVHCICCIHSYIALFPLSYSLWLISCWTFLFCYCRVI